MNVSNNFINYDWKRFFYILLFHVNLVLLGIETKDKPETTITATQSIPKSAASHTTDNLTTKMNEIQKKNVKPGMFKYNYSQKNIEEFIFIGTLILKQIK